MMQKHAILAASPARSGTFGGPPVVVVMAVYRPDPAHLRAQLASIAAQTHTDLHLIAVIADTASGAVLRAAAAEAGLDDAVTVEPEGPLDAVRAFECGIAEALRLIDAMGPGGEDALIALSDQDDLWHPDRVARGVERLAGTSLQLVHSDARVVAADGETLLHSTVFGYERRHKAPGLRQLLYRNTVTGMTLLMRARLARLALPFPQQSGIHFYHDLWLALLAEATGGIGLIEEPLVDYRQHGANAIGAVDRRTRRASRWLPDRMWLRREAASYALARYLAQSAQNRLVEAVADGRLRHGEASNAPLRPFLRRLRGAETHLFDAARLLLTGYAGLARIAAGFAVVSLGRSVWALREALGAGLNAAIDEFDTRLYSLAPGVNPCPPRVGTGEPEGGHRPVNWERLIDTRKRPSWVPAFAAPRPAFVVLVPTLNPTEIFAGVATALDIGLGLANRGLPVRFVATDLPISSPNASQGFLLSRLGAGTVEPALTDRISLQCGVSASSLLAHPGDVFLATAWWSAHVADTLIREHGLRHSRFYYLIQDYEPNFYPWGPEFADALASYDFDFEPVFNTTLLRDHFAAQGFGFAGPSALAFHPAIDVARYAKRTRPDRARGTPRRLALYGRPEVPRNMYATAIESLGRFLEVEALEPREIELVSVGLAHAPVVLPGGHLLKSLGKLPWDEYPDFLLETDVGLSLMYSPHPSHPPIEMAASGVRVVTNRFGPKDLAALSPAIDSVEATIPALTGALSRAWKAPPVPPEARAMDLALLGMPQAELLDALARRLAPALGEERAAS
jgi:hypothetical protein